jgi:hypothetical protein
MLAKETVPFEASIESVRNEETFLMKFVLHSRLERLAWSLAPSNGGGLIKSVQQRVRVRKVNAGKRTLVF